jgi:hypothetical protein
MQKIPFLRLTLTSLAALSLIPITYTLINRQDAHKDAETTPCATQPNAVARHRAAADFHDTCGHCSETPASSRPTTAKKQTAVTGLLWESSLPDPASAVVSQAITSGMPQAENFQPGSRQRLYLEDGTEIEIDVQSRHVHTDDTVAINAIVPGQPQGNLHIQWNKRDDFFLGQIEYPNHPVAYEIKLNDEGIPTITRSSIDQLLCAEVDPQTKKVTYGLPAVDATMAAEIDQAAEGTGDTTATDEAAMFVPALNSYPSAEAVIYLDFDGEQVNGTSWGTSITAAATGYSSTKITDIWKQVAADMEPFNLNVTTDESVYLSAPSNRRIRCIITPSNEWYSNPSVGGVAKRSAFSWSGDTPCWVFSDNLANGTKYVAECCSHEVGHTLGLTHDGKSTTTYYAGHGSGDVGWAPIMGNSYYKTLTQWSIGEYTGATNTQDDLNIITSSTNGFGYRSDDHSGKKQSATAIPRNASDQVSGSGVIESRGDVDVFEVQSGAGSISLEISPASGISNLDISAELYDSQGGLVASDNPATKLNANINTTVEAGTYYLHVKATGYGTADTGSTDYASLGSYAVSGQMAAEQVPTPYELSVASLPENERALGDDPDGDGMTNLAEHVLGTNPAIANASQNFTHIDPSGATGADFLIDLPADIPADATYVVEASCSLAAADWESMATWDGSGQWSGSPNVAVSEETGPQGKKRFRVTDSSGETWTCRFMRVRLGVSTNS